MRSRPIYAEKVIVGIIHKEKFNWFVTDVNFWYMDRIKWTNGFLKQGYDIRDPHNHSERFGIAILNEDTCECFLNNIKDCQINTDELRTMMKTRVDEIEYFDDILDFSPNFLVDFDKRCFFSLYPEMIHFENYVPEGWRGEERNFTSDIPGECKYWIADGIDLFDYCYHNKKRYSNA